MKLVYVSGVLSGSNSWETENNVRAIEGMSRRLFVKGYLPISTHIGLRPFSIAEYPSENIALQVSIELICLSDAILILNTSRTDIRILEELKLAEKMKIPTFSSMESLCQNMSPR